MSNKKEEAKVPTGDEATAPVAPKAPGNDLVEVFIDPVATDGGLVTNEKRYIGHVKVSRDIADDLMRRVAEYAEVKNKLFNPRQKIRIKNHTVIEQLYLADPAENAMKPGWTNEYGLLDPWQWQFLSPKAQEDLKNLRKALYDM